MINLAGTPEMTCKIFSALPETTPAAMAAWMPLRPPVLGPGCPETHFVNQAVLEILRNLPVSASQELGLKVCATMPISYRTFLMNQI